MGKVTRYTSFCKKALRKQDHVEVLLNRAAVSHRIAIRLIVDLKPEVRIRTAFSDKPSLLRSLQFF